MPHHESKPTCKPRTAVAYARYSSAGQRDVSIEQQLSDIHQFARREGYTIVREYADHAKSGFKNVKDRAAFQQMMAAAPRGGFDTVIIWKSDRFSRSREDAAVYKGKLKRLGIRVVSAMEPIPEGSAGILLEGMLEATAEWYSRALSENVIRGMTDNARRCLFNGARVFGYDRGPDDHYVINEDEAGTVRQIFDLYVAGYSADAIAKQLNAQGVMQRNGRPWNLNRILVVIGNEKYMGTYHWGDIRVENGMPAIISESDFMEAQRMRRKTAKHYETSPADFLLTGRVFCGHCRHPMVGDSGTSKTGAKHYYYTCQGKKTLRICDKRSVQKDLLEETVVDFVLDHVLQGPAIERTVQAVMDAQKAALADSPLPALEAELAEKNKEIDNIIKAITQGIWTSKTGDTLRALEASAEELKEHIDALKYSQAQLIDPERVRFFLHRFHMRDRADPDLRRDIIQTFVNSVYVYDDHLKLVVNNVEGNEIIPYTDLPQVDSGSSDELLSGLPNSVHPNSAVTVYRVTMESVKKRA